MMYWGQMVFQDAGSVCMLEMKLFHDYLLFVIMMIGSGVFMWIGVLFVPQYGVNKNREIISTEMLWTSFPVFTLLFLAVPSIRFLYMIEEHDTVATNIKVTGHQWYWSYLYYDFMGIEYDSYMLPTNELKMGMYRLLDVDSRLILPSHSNIGVTVVASDVIHSWSLPALGVKMDATPGRSNCGIFNTGFSGIYYGQCSEICGANHSFMPIVLEALPEKYFVKWVDKMLE